MPEFYSTREIKASRKRRRCEECGHAIEVGEPYRSSAVKDEGEFYTMTSHGDCEIWASAVIYDCGDGRGLLRDEDPSDDYEPEDLLERIRENPPPAAVYARLPKSWRSFVDMALAKDPTPRPGATP